MTLEDIFLAGFNTLFEEFFHLYDFSLLFILFRDVLDTFGFDLTMIFLEALNLRNIEVEFILLIRW